MINDLAYQSLFTVFNNYQLLNSEDESALQNTFCHKLEVRKGQLLWEEGRHCEKMYFIVSGSLREFVNLDGKLKTTWIYFENEFVSDFRSFYKNEKSSLNFISLEDTKLIYTNRVDFKSLLNNSHKLESISKEIIIHQALKDTRMKHILMLNNPTDRYKLLLKTNKSLIKKVPSNYIADLIGVTPQSLSRIKKKLYKNEK